MSIVRALVVEAVEVTTASHLIYFPDGPANLTSRGLSSNPQELNFHYSSLFLPTHHLVALLPPSNPSGNPSPFPLLPYVPSWFVQNTRICVVLSRFPNCEDATEWEGEVMCAFKVGKKSFIIPTHISALKLFLPFSQLLSQLPHSLNFPPSSFHFPLLPSVASKHVYTDTL
jgi:hypothetical protein